MFLTKAIPKICETPLTLPVSAALLFLRRFGVLLLIPFLAAAQTLEKKVSIPPLKENASRYFYVPFEVPVNAQSLSVSYEYDKKAGVNVLDLGLFDSCFSKDKSDLCGFRGWSGGRRSTIFIAQNSASHGYIAGKIPAGTWRVILGLYKIAPEGVEVTVKIKINEIDLAAQAQLTEETAKTFDFTVRKRVAPSQSNGYTWFRGDLHMHTFNSDGNWSVKGILDYATANNLDFISITDHNTFSHHAEIDALTGTDKNLLVMRGEEVTTYGGHFNVWGLPSGKLVDFRVTPENSAQLTDVLRGGAMLKDAAGSKDVTGGKISSNVAASINHPTALCGGCDWSYGDEMWTVFTAVEIWNGGWDFQDEAALKKWDEMLRAGKRVRAVGASDSHAPPPAAAVHPDAANLAIGTPTDFVGAKKATQKEILAAIAAGRVWIAENPTYNLSFSGTTDDARAVIGENLSVSAGKEAKFEYSGAGFPLGATLALVSQGAVLRQTTLDKPDFAQTLIVKPKGEEYFRLEIRDSAGKMIAFTNPIYVRTK